MDLRQPFRGSAAVAAGLVTPARLRGPRFAQLFRGIHVRADTEIDFGVRCRAAALTAGGRGVLTGWAAAELLGAPCAPTGEPVEMAVPGGGRRRPGIVIHAAAFPPDEIVRSGGLRVTTPERTAFDLGRRSPILHALIGVDALRNGCEVDPAAVRALASRHLGARGSRQLATVLRRSTALADSPMETRIRVAIEDAGLPVPVLQHPAGPYLLDLAYPAIRLSVEYDGQTHLRPERARRDLTRQAYLSASGWTILRLPAEIVLHHPWEVAHRVRQELAARRSA